MYRHNCLWVGGLRAFSPALRSSYPGRVRFAASIGTAIFGAFVAMVLLIAALGGYGLYVLQAAGGFVVEVYDRPLMAINYGRAASLDFAEMDKEVMRREAAGTDRERAAIDARSIIWESSSTKTWPSRRRGRCMMTSRAPWVKSTTWSPRWNELRREPWAVYSRDLGPLAAKIVERFDVLAELATGHSFVQRRRVVSDVEFFQYTSAGALLLALLLAAGITLVLGRRIIRPLREAATIADRIAAGELQAPIPSGGQDETGMLLRSMTVMQQNIREMVEREQAQRRSAQNRLAEALENSREAGGASRCRRPHRHRQLAARKLLPATRAAAPKRHALHRGVPAGGRARRSGSVRPRFGTHPPALIFLSNGNCRSPMEDGCASAAARSETAASSC